MEFSILGSGSTGNALLVRNQGTVLLECGLPLRTLRRLAAAAGERLDDVRAILVSHEHSDHAGSVPAVARALGIPVYASEGTLRALPRGHYERRPIAPGQPLHVAGLEVDAFAVQHDTPEPLGFRFRSGSRALGYLTDTGRVTPSMVSMMRGCQGLVVESNHDPDLLRNGPYPRVLQQRIRGGRGHLDNDACSALLTQAVTGDTRRVVLHHLSQVNNTPELALATAHAGLARAGIPAPPMTAAVPTGPIGPFAL